MASTSLTTAWRQMSLSLRATRLGPCTRLALGSTPRYSSSAATATVPRELEPSVADIPIELATPAAQHFHTLKSSISPETLEAITVRPFRLTHMTPVQEQVLGMLPHISEPYHDSRKDNVRDLLVRAKTGTGKTLAFLVPAIEARIKAVEQAANGLDGLEAEKVKRNFARDTVGTLIISPTRELATQIAAEALRLSHHHKNFEVRLFTGGTSKTRQMREFMRGRKDIVVATPGRLRDLLTTEPYVEEGIRKAQTLVLDEADTLLDMGFRDDIGAILKYLPPSPQRQTFLFSATVSPSIRQIARQSLHESHRYINTVTEEDSPVHAHIPQHSTVLPSAAHQIPYVMRLLAHDQLTNMAANKEGGSKVIVFLPTTKMTQLFATMIRELSRDILPAGRNTKVFEIHSKRNQDARTNTSDAFRAEKGSYSVLVTSDVSARGVDYPGVTRVIQVGIPSSADQYIHRVGRTGRGGKTTGRGDIVLLPWEIGFLTWQLTDVPLKKVTVSELEAEVARLAVDLDTKGARQFWIDQHPDSANAAPSHDTRGRAMAPWDAFKNHVPYAPVNENVKSATESLLGRLDEEAIRETFLSMIGYYIGKVSELRVSKEDVMSGLKGWATDGMGMAQPPYISPQFLAKLGYSEGRGKRFGGSARGDMNRPRRNYDQQPWTGRGNVRARESTGRYNSSSNEDADSRPRYGSERGAPAWAAKPKSSSWGAKRHGDYESRRSPSRRDDAW